MNLSLSEPFFTLFNTALPTPTPPNKPLAADVDERTPVFLALDIESPPPPSKPDTTTTFKPPSPSSEGGGARDTKRVAKLVAPVALFLASVAVTLVMNPPADAGAVNHPYLLVAYAAFDYLAIFMGVGLCVHAILTPATTITCQVVWVQKQVMIMAVVSVFVAFVLRTCIVFPMAFLGFVWMVFMLAIVVVVFWLLIAWKRETPCGGPVQV
ncbi:hypothetical protein QJS04_geneDACA010488 [Acorus gramineus]|uniref:PGG domain-containing protein n=1 Tax=Acorus gramineus TaxID=55184 RepID=A0AAV9AN70_ACOGR|nr:hypothetical protein QJS04_geneDACA010488 [Acorus gramineus]